MIRSLTKDKSVTYEYNADGLRSKKKNHDYVTYFIWDGDQLVLELDKDAKVSKRYLRGNSIIRTDNGKDEEKTSYVTNPHGDVVQLLDKAGKVTRTYDYDAFGNEINPDEKDENPIRYAGEYFDVETETQYLRARYYAPELGRFISRDTYTGEDEDSLSLHLYTYCSNEPVGQVDPSGHWGVKLHKKITKDVLKKLKVTRTEYHDILIGCILPDKVKNGYCVSEDMSNAYSLYSRKKGFHGMDKTKLLKIKKNGLARRLFVNSFLGEKKEYTREFVMVGAILHAIQDYCAHSYIGSADTYKKKYKQNVLKGNKKTKFSKNERKYHSDYVKKIKDNKAYIGIDMKEHSRYKDSENYDFADGKWKKTSYKNNSRIKKAKNDSISYVKRYIKTPQGGFIYE